MTPYGDMLDCAQERLPRVGERSLYVMAINQRSYEADQVEAALMLAERGWSSVRISRESGIPDRTIREWLSAPEVAAKHNAAIVEARRRIALSTSQQVEAMLEAAEKSPLTPTQVMVNFGIAQDKHQADLKIAAAAEAPTIQRGPFVIFMGQSVQDVRTGDIETRSDIQATVTVLPPASAPDTKAEPEPKS